MVEHVKNAVQNTKEQCGQGNVMSKLHLNIARATKSRERASGRTIWPPLMDLVCMAGSRGILSHARKYQQWEVPLSAV